MNKKMISIGIVAGFAALIYSTPAFAEEGIVEKYHREYTECLKHNPPVEEKISEAYVPGRVIVGFENYVCEGYGQAFLEMEGYKVDDTFWSKTNKILMIKVPVGKEAEAISELESKCTKGFIKYAEPDYIIEIPPELRPSLELEP